MHFSPEKYLKDASVSYDELGGWSLYSEGPLRLLGLMAKRQQCSFGSLGPRLWLKGEPHDRETVVSSLVASKRKMWRNWYLQSSPRRGCGVRDTDDSIGRGLDSVMDTDFLAVDLQPPRCCRPIPWGMDSPPPPPWRWLFCLGLGPQGDSLRIFSLRNLEKPLL